MYTAHFGLNAAPFSITPDPHYLYLSGRHREALAHLLYGVNEGPGFVLLTGEVGTGKTTLCRSLIEQLSETVDVALLLNPRLSSMELLAALFDELRIHYEPDYSLKDFIDTLSSYLLTAHTVQRRTVLILDEAQNLSEEVLEQVRLLTNLETSSQKLLQIILVGQPELNKLLKQNNLRQLAQRITARYHLLPLSLKDTQAYINHRLAISGAKTPLFTDAAMRLIYRHSGGVPRLINILSDRALLGGYVKGKNQIDSQIVRKGVQEVRGENNLGERRSPLGWVVAMLTIILLAGGLMWWFSESDIAFFKQTTFSNGLSLSSDTQAAPENRLLEKPPDSLPVNLPPPAPPNLLDLLPQNTTESAFVSLFSRWELDYTSLVGDKACQRAETRGLTCLFRTGNWKDMRRFNRPAVIELVTEEAKQYLVVVTRLQNNVATLALSGQTFEFPIEAINEYWLGQFLVLWQPPTLPVPVLQVGISNESVIWIRKLLDEIEGLRGEPHTLSPLFDYALRRRVITFQRQQKLDPDGIVGERTLLALQALAGRGPRLFDL
ncbi:MAG: AAA family ATPase [Candidatus Parabeggiatoa sp.]|nr:AAA family ATPase [Candidatus Parabeggiatoa sp.]